MSSREEEWDSIYNTQFSRTKKQANEFGTLFRNMKMNFGVAKLIRPEGRQYKGRDRFVTLDTKHALLSMFMT
jgi:hypothetical protein